MNNDSHLIFEQYIKSKNPNKYLFEQDLKEFENFLIREGLFDKFKQKAAQAGSSIKNFASEKLLQPLVNQALSFLQKNDPETLKKLQTAAAKGDQKAIDSIIAQGNQEKQKIQQSLSTQQESVGYFDNYSIFSQIVFNEGLVSERKANFLIEKYAEEDGEADIAKGLGFKNREAFRVEYKKAGNINNYFKQNPDKAKQVNWDVNDSAANNFTKFTSGNVGAAPQPAGAAPQPAGAAPQPAGATPQPAAAGVTPQEGNKEGFIKKAYNWVKANPIKTSLGALAVLGVVAAAAPAIAPAMLAGALKGGGIGAATGAVTGTIQGMKDTKGQLKGMDRFKQVAKTAGKKALTKGLAGAAIGGTVGGITGAITNKFQAAADAKEIAANADAVDQTTQMRADQLQTQANAADYYNSQEFQNPRLSPGGNRIPIENDPLATLDSQGRGGWRPSRGSTNPLVRSKIKALKQAADSGELFTGDSAGETTKKVGGFIKKAKGAIGSRLR